MTEVDHEYEAEKAEWRRDTSDAMPPRLQLEVGKTYRNREGDKVKIVGMRAGTPYRYEGDDGFHYAEDGRFDIDQPDHAFDLVAEEPDTTEPKPPEGQKNTAEDFYRVENEERHCPNCNRGGLWQVVGADDIGDSTFFEDEDDANELCDKLNDAHRKALATRVESGLVKELATALADAVDSLKYVQDAHPEASGWGVRAERIQKAEAILAKAKPQAPAPDDDGKPPEVFAHLFDDKGNVL